MAIVKHYRLDPDVERVADEVRARWPGLDVYTYVGHPWPGWDGRSIDINYRRWPNWAIDATLGWEVLNFLRRLPGFPYIRHHIYEHQLWTSFGGYSWWGPNDHAGAMRHVHVTYWRR